LLDNIKFVITLYNHSVAVHR